MSNRTNKRLQGVENAMAAKPIRKDLLRSSFRHFCKTGELPEQRRLATEVVARVLTPPRESQGPLSIEDLIKTIEEISVGTSPASADTPIRRHLLQEAVHENEIVREAARGVLRLAIAAGADIKSPGFLAGETLPEFGSVGLHLLGFPQVLCKPPYEEQVRRLMARLAGVRARIDPSNPAWFAPHEAAIREFLDDGVLPDDELLMESALGYAELLAFVNQHLGRGDAELLAAFNAVVQATKDARMEALAEVQELMRARRLFVGAE